MTAGSYSRVAGDRLAVSRLDSTCLSPSIAARCQCCLSTDALGPTMTDKAKRVSGVAEGADTSSPANPGKDLFTGVVYVEGLSVSTPSLGGDTLSRLLDTGYFKHSKVDSKGGKKLTEHVVFYSSSSGITHSDLFRIRKDDKITVRVPVRFTGEENAPGLNSGRGVLGIANHEVDLIVRADDIPNELVVPLDGLEVADIIRLGEVDLPHGAELPADSKNVVIASIEEAGIDGDDVLAALIDIMRTRYEALLGEPSAHLAYIVQKTQLTREAADVQQG